MGFKADFKHEIRNVIKDVEKEINKTWKIEYKEIILSLDNIF